MEQARVEIQGADSVLDFGLSLLACQTLTHMARTEPDVGTCRPVDCMSCHFGVIQFIPIS